MTGATAKSRPGRFPWALLVLICLGLYAFQYFAFARLGLAGRYVDPDDVMRLVQVRDLLGGQGWFDLHQYRIDPPHSPLMHWSRVVDAPLAATIWLFSPILGRAQAETAAAVVVPWLTLAAMVFPVAWMAFRLFGRRTALFAGVLFVTSELAMAQVKPMRIDHHGWQIVSVVVAASTLLYANRARGGWIAGLALAAGMSISIEVLPFAAAFAAALALRWFGERQERQWLAHFLAALATGLLVLTALTRGWGDGQVYCDVVSMPHLVLFAWVALAAALIVRTSSLPAFAALGLLGLAGLAGVAAFVVLAPQCAGSPFASLDPLVHRFWYTSVLEGQPIWKQPLPAALAPLLQALVAIGALVVLWRRTAGPERRFWLSYGVFLCASFLVGLFVWRSMAFTGALCVLPLAWLADRVVERVKAQRDRPHTALRQIAFGLGGFVLLMPSSVIGLARPLFPADDATIASGPADCDIDKSAGLLNGVPRGKVFAPLDIGPDILLATPDSVVATGHHRAQAAMADVIRAFLSPEQQAHAIMVAHRASLVVVCTDLDEAKTYQAAAPHGLMAQLVRGQAPAWLQPVAVRGPASFKVWRIVS